MIKDEVLFTPHLATIVVDLHRGIEKTINDTCGVTYLAFCLLASLHSHQGSMTFADFPRNMLANENTVIVAGGELSSAGFAEKHRCPDDRRIVRLHETTQGAAALKTGFAKIFHKLKTTVWQNHSEADIEEIMDSFPSVAEKLGIGPGEINRQCHPTLTPAYLMIITAMLRCWSQTVSRYAGLSFTEYRCLSLLENRPIPLSCATIAETLLLDRSSVSSLAARLRHADLVSVSIGIDKRQRTVELTAKGEVCAALVTAKLGRITVDLYAGATPLLKSKTNELHMRMYASYAR